MTYDEHSIKVLGEANATARFGYLRGPELHARHPHVPLEVCERLVTACDLSGWDLALAERRYCCSDRTVAPPEEFQAAYHALVAEKRSKKL